MSRSNDGVRNARWVELEERQTFQLSWRHWTRDEEWNEVEKEELFVSKDYGECKAHRDLLLMDEELGISYISFKIVETVKFDDEEL
tara:strand:- start:949 stop:1206 length:258 start_codon:yes stop_codon:yes gene_type:complete